MDLIEIEKRYEKMSDNELVKIATTNAHGLRPEVFQIIENEIKKRNLNPDILKGAIAQNKDYSIEEIENFAKILRVLPCPICGNATEKLNGTILHTVKSFIFFTQSKKEPIIACSNCLDKKNNHAMLTTAALGWWGLPWGFIKTPIYIYKNYKAKHENSINKPNNTLLSFTLSNIGEIESFINNKEKLKEIIKAKEY